MTARDWVDALVAGSDDVDTTGLPPRMQIEVLRECVTRMPDMRSRRDRESYAAGKRLYDVACQLYKRKLPFDESDVCALLETSRHTCGHGSDVAKRRGAIMLLADPQEVAGSESGWSARFREGLRSLPPDERRQWQQLVLAMKANDVYEPPGRREPNLQTSHLAH